MLLVGENYPLQLGAVLLGPNNISDVVAIAGEDDNHASSPMVSFDGTNYLVVWKDWNDTVGQRIDVNGELEGPRFVVIEKDSVTVAGIAGGNGIHLLAWCEGGKIRIMRVTSDGQVLDPEGLAVAEVLSGYVTSVAFDGTSFFVAWTTRSDFDDPNSYDLRAVEVTSAGEVVSEFAISTEPGSETPATLAGADGRVLAAYSRFVPGAPYDSFRAQARLITRLPAMDLDVQAPGGMSPSPTDLRVQAGGPQTPIATSQTWPSPHSASDLHGGFLPAGGAVLSPAASAHASSPM
jgi:hypothetical protein